ncbi:hypothetical protein GF326_02570 [Candidatus Bathyarchaeota archaeon]|nr:hypothetical protein [Candidatus Bathyarchaeota archaeon]
MKQRKLVLFTLIITVFLTPIFTAQGIKVITEPISKPLPTLPQSVLQGGTLRVETISNMPQDVSASLVSPYDEADLTLTEGPTDSDGTWILEFTVPMVRPGLYDLYITFTGTEYIQERSVWVMTEWPENLTISQISDIHQPYGGNNFTHYVYEQNLLNPDMIFVTGDIVDVETIRAAWENVQGTMKYSTVPIYFQPGNHDYTNGAQYYKQFGGKTNYTVTLGDFFIVSLNSHGGGYVKLDEIAWADNILSENQDKVKIIAFHHPLFSGEYEVDQGSLKGGEITGSWDNIEELEDIMYFTWSQNMDNAREMLKVIEENDVNIIMSGHVHRDLIYHLNDQHHFITTTTIGGGSGQYRGYRHITVGVDGLVQLDEYGETRKYDPPNSIPLENIKYLYKRSNDGTGTAASAIVKNDLSMTLEDAKLEFIVDKTLDPSAYTFTEEPKYYEVITSSEGHHFITYYDIPPESMFTTTISAEPDTTSPDITIHLPENYDEGTDVFGSISITDDGWGVEKINAEYSIDGSTWTSIPLDLAPKISPTEWIISYAEDYYEFTIPGEGEIELKVDATDFAGNTVSEQSTVYPTVPKPTTNLANITYDSITASSTTAEAGVPITITITLNNTGDKQGNETVELYINDELTDSETVTVEEGATETVSFTIKMDEAGTYNLVAGDKATIITVTEPEQEPSGGIPVSPVFTVIGLISTVYLLSKRKTL